MIGAVHEGIARLGNEPGTAQVGIAQVGTRELGATEVGTSKVGIAQVGLHQLSVRKDGLEQESTLQVSIVQVCTAQGYAPQARTAQVCVLKADDGKRLVSFLSHQLSFDQEAHDLSFADRVQPSQHR